MLIDLMKCARMPKACWIAGLAWILFLAQSALAQTANTGLMGPVPAWVKAVEAPASGPGVADQTRRGMDYLLTDVQVRVDARGKQQYRHFAMKALNERGVEEIANLEVRFDPSYETLKLHSITVRRGTEHIERLPSAQLRVLQREKELDYLIFDGSKTANVFLEDIRVGDVVEYAYTISGSNPVFAGKNFGQFTFQWSTPVKQVYTRLLWPAGRPLYFKSRNDAPQAERKVRGSEVEYEWQLADVPGRIVNADTPSWFSPYPVAQWGEFESWSSVAQWALPLYQPPAVLPPELKAVVSRIADSTPVPLQRAAEVLRFVQSEIRYMGVEVGVGSHAPNPPGLVFARRFGDCKDKTLLTLTLFKALGLQARAALVNTDDKRALGTYLPSPAAFDHVIVRADIDGKAYWLDPTRRKQPGGLNAISQPNFDLALLVDPDTRELEPMSPGAAALHKRKVHILLDSRDGLDHAVGMTVTTRLQGLAAEQMRNNLAGEDATELQKRFLNFYAGSYPGITTQSPFEVVDDQASNTLQLVEHYLIKDFWVHVDKRNRLEGNIEVPELMSYLRAPREVIRQAPLMKPYPQELEHDVELRLPENWTFKNSSTLIEDPNFVLRREVRGGDRSLFIADRYRALTDHIEASAVAKYVENLDKSRDAVGYVVFSGGKRFGEVPASGGSFNLSVALLGAMLAGGFVWLAVRVYQWDQIKAPADAVYQKLGGWLIPLLLSLVASIWMTALLLWRSLPAYGSEKWANSTIIGAEHYHPWMAAVLLGEMTMALSGIVFGVLLVVLCCKRRQSFPVVLQVFIWGFLLLQAVDTICMLYMDVPHQNSGAESLKSLAYNACMTAIWSAYLYKSARVKGTFVQRYPANEVSGKPVLRSSLAIAEPANMAVAESTP